MAQASSLWATAANPDVRPFPGQLQVPVRATRRVAHVGVTFFHRRGGVSPPPAPIPPFAKGGAWWRRLPACAAVRADPPVRPLFPYPPGAMKPVLRGQAEPRPPAKAPGTYHFPCLDQRGDRRDNGYSWNSHSRRSSSRRH